MLTTTVMVALFPLSMVRMDCPPNPQIRVTTPIKLHHSLSNTHHHHHLVNTQLTVLLTLGQVLVILTRQHHLVWQVHPQVLLVLSRCRVQVSVLSLVGFCIKHATLYM